MIAENTALGRAGLPEDLGPMIASLLSEENHWVNAQRIEVAGIPNLNEPPGNTFPLLRVFSVRRAAVHG
jgi:hypothetical protein